MFVVFGLVESQDQVLEISSDSSILRFVGVPTSALYFYFSVGMNE